MCGNDGREKSVPHFRIGGDAEAIELASAIVLAKEANLAAHLVWLWKRLDFVLVLGANRRAA
jgi:hypothetical protein